MLENGYYLHFAWVLGHHGVFDNKIADYHATRTVRAILQSFFTLTPILVYYANFWNHTQSLWQQAWLESLTGNDFYALQPLVDSKFWSALLTHP